MSAGAAKKPGPGRTSGNIFCADRSTTRPREEVARSVARLRSTPLLPKTTVSIRTRVYLTKPSMASRIVLESVKDPAVGLKSPPNQSLLIVRSAKARMIESKRLYRPLKKPREERLASLVRKASERSRNAVAAALVWVGGGTG